MNARRGFYGSLSTTTAAGLGAVASFALTIYVAHHGGLDLLGTYAVMVTVFSVFGVVDSARTQDLTTRYAIGGGNESTRIRALLAAVGIAIAVEAPSAMARRQARAAQRPALAAWLGAVVQFMSAEVVAATQVQQKFQRLAFANGAGALAGSGTAAILLSRAGLLALGIGLLVTAVLPRLILLADADVRAWVRTPAKTADPVRSQARSLLLLGGAAQLVNFTDVISIRALATAPEVGVYRAGSQFPTLLVGLLYRGFDILMPRLAEGSEPDAAALTRRAAPKFAVVVGQLWAARIGLRGQLVHLVLGHANHDAETVLWLFAAVWIVNSVVHPAALLLIARRRQSSIVRLVGSSTSRTWS